MISPIWAVKLFLFILLHTLEKLWCYACVRQTVPFTRPSRHSFYQMPFIQAAGQFLFYLRLLPAVIPCLPPHRFYRVRM